MSQKQGDESHRLALEEREEGPVSDIEDTVRTPRHLSRAVFTQTDFLVKIVLYRVT